MVTEILVHMQETLPELSSDATERSDRDIDAKIKGRHVEYYAKVLHIIRNWLAECLGEEHVPPAYELEESLRSGVLLARIANYFNPQLVPMEKLFDPNLSRFGDRGLEYRHTDNILQWRRACLALKLNPIILPEPVDIYAGRNTRTIFALISLANLLRRMGKAPPLRKSSKIVLADDEYQTIATRMEIAVAAEGIDWDQIEEEQFALENMSLPAEETVEVSDNSLQSLRYLCKTLDISHNLYEKDLLLEDQKIRVNKLLESNDAMRKDLEVIESNIGLLVKNFRSIKDNSDKKAEVERRHELEKACQMQRSSLSDDDSVYNDENSTPSSYDEEEPRSLARVSRQTTESHNDPRIPYDYLLAAKSHILTLLHSGLHAETIKELTTTKHFANVDEHVQNTVAEVQNLLAHTLQKLIETRRIPNDGIYHDLLKAIFDDIRNEGDLERRREERQKEVDAVMDRASKEAQQMMSQIEAYRNYEQVCLNNMAGGAPSIKLSDELNKKIRKFLSRKQKAVNKQPVKLNGEKMIKKKVVFCDDTTTPKRVAKYSLVITPLNDPGYYKFESILDGQVKHTQTIVFEELLRREALGQYRLPFDEPLVFDCLGLRRFLDSKYHSKVFT